MVSLIAPEPHGFPRGVIGSIEDFKSNVPGFESRGGAALFVAQLALDSEKTQLCDEYVLRALFEAQSEAQEVCVCVGGAEPLQLRAEI